MATASLIENFQSLVVKDDSDTIQAHAKCLPFKPWPDFGISPRKVDRYLFRLFDKRSDGSMDSIWVKSRDAKQTRFHYDKDIFEREDRDEAAQALRRHLQWKGQPGEEDNFVSWSSSLLFVLQYAHYRARHFPNSDFREMFLCVVDTTLLPPKVFMRDTDLLMAFSRYDNSGGNDTLQGLQLLRQKRHAQYNGFYDFGEYLSQGALRIEKCCRIVSMADIRDAGLYTLREELESAVTTKEKWANRVLNLRQIFYETGICYLAHDYEVKYALRIGSKFGPTWDVPIALAFLALKPRRIPDEAMVEEFRPLCCRGKCLSVMS